MRKMLSVMMAAAIAGSLLAGCSSSTTETTAAASSAEETTTAAEETTTEAASESAAENIGDETVVRVGGLKGPTTMGLVKLMDEAANGESENSYEFTMVTAADEMTAMVAGGKVDIALLPANVASVLYNKTNKNISVIDINTLGVLYFVSADSSGATLGSILPFFSSSQNRCMTGSTPAEVPERIDVLDVGAMASRYAFRIPFFCISPARFFHAFVL